MSSVVRKYFLPICSLSLPPLSELLHRVKISDIDQVQFVNVFLVRITLWLPRAYPDVPKAFYCFLLKVLEFCFWV